MSPYRMPPIWALFRPPMWPAGPVFLTLRPVWALGPRLCSLSVSGLAVENSASVEIRIGAVCDHAAQEICGQIDAFNRWLFRCVLGAVPDTLYLAV